MDSPFAIFQFFVTADVSWKCIHKTETVLFCTAVQWSVTISTHILYFSFSQFTEVDDNTQNNFGLSCFLGK